MLFIDARKKGTMTSRVLRELTETDIGEIAGAYHAFRGDGNGKYGDVPGFCKMATLEEIQGHDYVLTPGRYVGAEEVEADAEPLEEKMARLATALREQMAEGTRLDKVIRKNLERLGYGE